MIARFRAAGVKGAGIVACAVLAAALGARAQGAGTDPIYTDAAARAQAKADAARGDLATAREKLDALVSEEAKEQADKDAQAKVRADVAEAKTALDTARAQLAQVKSDTAATREWEAETDAARRAAANQIADVKVDAAVLARLAAKADQAVDVTLDQPMLQAASAFLNAKDPKQVEAKKLVAKLQGVYVHNYEFSKPGEYSAADVQSLRAPFQGGAWSRAVNVQSKRDAQNVEVYMKKGEGKIQGLVVIAVEPQQVTFIHIMGAIEPQDLANLSGQFGIPPLRIGSH